MKNIDKIELSKDGQIVEQGEDFVITLEWLTEQGSRELMHQGYFELPADGHDWHMFDDTLEPKKYYRYMLTVDDPKSVCVTETIDEKLFRNEYYGGCACIMELWLDTENHHGMYFTKVWMTPYSARVIDFKQDSIHEIFKLIKKELYFKKVSFLR